MVTSQHAAFIDQALT